MLQTLKVSVSDLALGMFVSGLDRPWLGTPFYTQGFLLESDDDLRQVRELCNFVYIDTRKSRYISPKIARQGQVGRNRIPLDAIFTGRNLTPYRDANDWKDEHPRAKAALDKLVVDISDIYDQAAVRGKIDAVRIKKVASPLIDSIKRNPDACLWLGRLKQHDEYSYHHSISTTIWAIALGRQLGMQRHDLRSLAVGGMLMDVGKLLVDPELLRAERTLTPEEMREVRHHVAHGVHLVKKSGIQNQDVLDMVGFHHERWDGSGYPRGLSGDNIPPFARLAAIVDAYDAMTSERPYAPAKAPADALRELYQERDQLFQSELVEAFIQAIGIYPAGTLVELTSGEVGIVVADSRTRRLLPKIILVLDPRKREYDTPKLVDLQEASRRSRGEPVAIASSLPPGTHGIHLGNYQLNL